MIHSMTVALFHADFWIPAVAFHFSEKSSVIKKHPSFMRAAARAAARPTVRTIVLNESSVAVFFFKARQLRRKDMRMYVDFFRS
jgi:hypothetical protein